MWLKKLTPLAGKRNVAVVSVTSLAFVFLGFFGMWMNTVYGKYCGIGTWLPQVPKGSHCRLK